MADLSIEVVAALLAHHGLTGPSFDVEAVTEDLAAALDSAATLDEVIDGAALTDAVRFDVRWSSP